MTRYLVTSALPYANGPIHFGHIAGAYLPADIYTRYLKMVHGSDNVLYVCGTDEYGVAITIKAESEGNDYENYVGRWHNEIKTLFERFGIEFNVFSGTSRCKYHEATSQKFFKNLLDNGFVFKRSEKQWYSTKSERFLPDRYLQGECPECGFNEARGDECPKCGLWIDPLQFKDPISIIDQSSPVLKETTHWYLDLPKLQKHGLDEWYQGESDDHKIKGWKTNVNGHVQAMLKDLQPRPITRDLPWGVPLPESVSQNSGKVLYVWFDAPIGYISATMEWAEKQGNVNKWKEWWQNPETKLCHFIGKDNIAFHCVVFPAMLLGQNKSFDNKSFIMPWSVPANEFYNLQGKKFSTSNNWHIDNDSFFEKYNSDAARFHLTLSAPETSDSEFNWKEFQNTNNSLLADKLGNLLSRVIKFTQKRFNNQVPEATKILDDPLLDQTRDEFKKIGEHINKNELRKAAQALIQGCSNLNQFFDKQEPWKKIKSADEKDQLECAQTIERCLAHFRILVKRFLPFCPISAIKINEMLGDISANLEEWGDDSCPELLPSQAALGEAYVLFNKIEDDIVEAEIEALIKK
jgi:methionyl-tRNA synthetase